MGRKESENHPSTYSATNKESYDRFRSDIRAGKLFVNGFEYPETHERRWVIGKGRRWPGCLEDGIYPYIVMPDGEIRFSENPRPESKIHHPELCNGEEVVGAGMLELREGKIERLTNESGHYSPDGMSMFFVKMAFEYWETPLSPELEIDTRWEMFI